MRVLVIDTSTAAILAAVVELDADASVRVVSERITVALHRHTELLAPAVRDVLAEADGVRAVVAGVGPGPFTGLRVGLATAAGLALVRGWPTYPVCSLDGIGLALPDEADLLVATDARRREIYWARYRRGERVAGPAVSRPTALAEQWAADPASAPGSLVGAGAATYAELLGANPSDRPLREHAHPDPVALVRAAAGRLTDGAPSEPLRPDYLREPDAVPPAAMRER